MNALYLLSGLDADGYTVLRFLLSILWQSTILFATVGALAYFLRGPECGGSSCNLDRGGAWAPSPSPNLDGCGADRISPYRDRDYSGI